MSRGIYENAATPPRDHVFKVKYFKTSLHMILINCSTSLVTTEYSFSDHPQCLPYFSSYYVRTFFSITMPLADFKVKQLHAVHMYRYFCWVFVLPLLQQLDWRWKRTGEEKLPLSTSIYPVSSLWTKISRVQCFCKNASLVL